MWCVMNGVRDLWCARCTVYVYAKWSLYMNLLLTSTCTPTKLTIFPSASLSGAKKIWL